MPLPPELLSGPTDSHSRTLTATAVAEIGQRAPNKTPAALSHLLATAFEAYEITTNTLIHFN